MAEPDRSGAAREAALAEIRHLAETHGIGAAEIGAALAGDGSGDAAQSGVIARVTAYLGGLFVFAGIAALIAVNWEAFPSAARVLITLGLGLALFVAALIVDLDRRWPALVAPGYLAALALEPTGMMVAFDEYGGGDARWAMLLTSFAVALQCAVTLAGTRQRSGHAVLLFAATLFGASFWATAFGLAGVDEDRASLTIGVALLLVSFAIDGRRYRWNAALWALAGATLAFVALWDLLRDTPLEVLFALLAMGGVYLSVVMQSRSLLFTSVAALLFYIGYFTAEYFADSLGWPLALMLIGVAFVVVGRLALRLKRRYFSGAGE
jgi:hypothetical protein